MDRDFMRKPGVLAAVLIPWGGLVSALDYGEVTGVGTVLLEKNPDGKKTLLLLMLEVLTFSVFLSGD